MAVEWASCGVAVRLEDHSDFGGVGPLDLLILT